MHPIDRYARTITRGRGVLAGKYHRLACERHLRDREREGTRAFPYRFVPALADRFYRFAARLKHYKGEWAGQYIVLEPHQQFRLGSLFAWVHPGTGLRRFRTTYDELPRKNGKTIEKAIVMLYLTFFDGEAGAEGYCIANKREQAKIVFDDCKRLVASSGLRSRIVGLTTNLHRDATASKLEPLGADRDSTDGLNPHCVVIDEAHAMKSRGLIDVMETAIGARRQPVISWITTAGNSPVSPCGDQHDYACKVLERVLVDETLFAFIAHADDGDDWTDERTWRKANPNYGVSVKPADLRALVRKAIHMPAAMNAFKQKRLNLWVNVDAPWLSMEGWRAGQSRDWTPDDLIGEPCFVGIDLASKLDLCAMVFVFPPTASRLRWRLVRWVWTPQDTLPDRAHRDRAPYDIWAEQTGFDGEPVLRTTPGTQVNHQLLRTVLRAQRSRFAIERIGLDPWHADTLIDQLIDEDGFDRECVVEVPQTYAGMSSGASAYEALVLAGLVDAGDCPLMTWTHANAVVQRDGKDNIFPIKKKSRGRIDPVMAAVIAVNLQLRARPDEPAADPVLVVA